jgi:hypothetical protein
MSELETRPTFLRDLIKPLLIIVLLLIIGALFVFFGKDKQGVISSFQECIDAGYPVMESYPRQCRTSDGGYFVEEIIPLKR